MREPSDSNRDIGECLARWAAATVTAAAGSYALRLSASGAGITDAAGNALQLDATDSWITDTTPPTADIVDIVPDPRNTPVGN